MKNTHRVCIIDDEANIREVYEKRFVIDGFQVAVASDGEEGLRVIETFNPDVVLLDLQMPVKNGLDVLQALFDTGKLKQFPIVLLTNMNSEDIFQETVKFNVRLHLLLKSMITPKMAVEYVRNLLEGKPVD